MSHGRSLARWTLCASALLFHGVCYAQEAPAPAPLRFAWEQSNHASGVYHVKADATLTVVVDNVSTEPADLAGEILFGSRTGNQGGGAGTAPAADFKIISVTPIAPATIAPRQRVKIPLQVAFGAAGTYALRWKQGGGTSGDLAPIDSTTGVSLQCIFAPRTVKPAATAPVAGAGWGGGGSEESPWITVLPTAAVRTPGFLADYMQQTTVCRFLIDERFAYDAATNVGLGFGASTGAGAKELDAFFAEAAKVTTGEKCHFVLRLTVPVGTGTGPTGGGADARPVAALREYLTDAIRRSKGTLAAIAIVPGVPVGEPASGPGAPSEAIPDALRHNFTTLYLAAYDAAKRADRNVVLLGAGSAQLTAQWLAPDPKLLAYVDALAIADAAADPSLARQLLADRKAGGGGPARLQLLPPPGAGVGTNTHWPPAAAALAQGAAIVAVPPPEIDHGVTAHLLGGAVLLERVQLSVPTADAPQTSRVPFIAVFQGDGYAVAAIAGFSAGTDLDAAYPALARTRTQVEAPAARKGDTPAYPNLQVGDDTHSMRVVDAMGDPVDCRVGDNIYVPAGDAVVYLLQGGTAEDLAGSLRPATANFLPLFEITLLQQPDGALALRLRNCATKETAGTARLIHPPGGGADATEAATLLAEKEFPPISPDKFLDIPLSIPPSQTPQLISPLVVEITTTGNKPLIQRTAVPLRRE